MNIYTFNYKGDERKVDKGLTIDKAVNVFENVIWKDDTSINNPSILIRNWNDVLNVRNENYVYIPRFGCYYFVRDYILHSGGIIELVCEVDVLMSFKADILKSSQYVKRQEKIKNKYLVDAKMPTDTRVDVRTFDLGTIDISGAGEVVLTTTGMAEVEGE